MRFARDDTRPGRSEAPAVLPGVDTTAGRSLWRPDALALLLVLGVAIVLWLPRGYGPIDMRWDGAVYYILGTSLAEGRGYKLLNEPGQIDAVQYPPLLPAIVAAHQLALGTTDPATVGRWLRLSSFFAFLAYVAVVLRFLRAYLPLPHALVGALLSIFCLYAWFLSNVLFPEMWFAAVTLLFLMLLRTDGAPARDALVYGLAVAAFALRTVGIVALGLWVLDSAVKRRFRQALVRAALAAIPIVGWQAYVASVERSPGYRNPAYEYQRAPYMFYNVPYARNISLRDPFAPEKGEVRILRRAARNALDLPMYLGESLSASRRYFGTWLHALIGDGPLERQLVRGTTFVALSGLGLLVGGGLVRLLLIGEYVVPLYLLGYLAALSLTPFPDQFSRYLMPVVPLSALCAFAMLRPRAGAAPESGRQQRSRRLLPFVVLIPALLVQIGVTAAVYARRFEAVTYTDRHGRQVSAPLFFYDERGLDEAVDYVQAHAAPNEVVAAGTPHWIHLRTGMTTVMPPFEPDPIRAQTLLDSVPVEYLIVGADVVASERYTVPVLRAFPSRWQRVYLARDGWAVYRRQGS